MLHGLGDPQLQPDCSAAGFVPNLSFVERVFSLTTQSSNGEVVNRALIEQAQAHVCILADWVNPRVPAAHAIYASLNLDGQTLVGRGTCSVYGSVAPGVILPICEMAILNPPAGYRFGKIAANGLFNLRNNPDYPLADCYWTVRFHE